MRPHPVRSDEPEDGLGAHVEQQVEHAEVGPEAVAAGEVHQGPVAQTQIQVQVPQADVAQTVALVVFIVEEEYIQFADLLQEGVFVCDEGCGGVVAVVTGWEFGPFVEKDDLAVFPVGLQKAFRQSGGRLVEGKENVAFPGVGES